jgi:iron complex outermembrane receptor protein
VTAAPVAGNWLPSAPANSGNLWEKYTADGDFKGLSVGGCLNIIGSQFWDNANSFKLPQYTLVNGMISCRFPWQGAKITAQLNIKNLFDTAFYQSAGNRYYIISGAPRAILSSRRAGILNHGPARLRQAAPLRGICWRGFSLSKASPAVCLPSTDS